MITNLQNEQIKNLAGLNRRKGRKETGRFLIEGVRFVEEALNAGVRPEQVVISPKLVETERGRVLQERCTALALPVLEVDQRVLAKLADTENPQGIAAVVAQPQWSWPGSLAEAAAGQALPPAVRPSWWLAVDRVQDPGNLGTIVRTAHAAGAAGIILTPGTVDIYNPKTLRSTMGSVFHLPVLSDRSPSDILSHAEKLGWQVVVGDPGANLDYYEVNWRQSSLIVLGSESQGPAREFVEAAAKRVRIAMPGGAESLNVAVAAGVLLFEAVRQTQIIRHPTVVNPN